MKKFKVQVDSIKSETEEIRSYVLVDPEGGELPEFAAGAHIDLHLDNGLVRQFSLCGPAWERQSYLIGVLLEQSGTGGSQYIHSNVRVGDRLEISEPKRWFKLNPDAQTHLMIAGGIGVAPILAMAYSLERSKADYIFHYCTRFPEQTAFMDEITGLVKHGSLHWHFDGGNPENGLDFKTTLQDYSPGTHLYYCGPVGMMNAIADASSHWPEGTVHYEFFSTDGVVLTNTDSFDENKEFQIRISSTNTLYSVPAHKTIVEVLRENGHDVDTSCEDGYCGTCLTRYLQGEPDHRDQILDDEDHEEYVLICCARSRTQELVLDL
ncbi:MAG: PDR/VanB family oxidoreductase [Acidiferrobacterales bacterium]|nr:PDR/VanB family oxidoreductase [Acidiferrobacterales bacterium]